MRNDTVHASKKLRSKVEKRHAHNATRQKVINAMRKLEMIWTNEKKKKVFMEKVIFYLGFKNNILNFAYYVPGSIPGAGNNNNKQKD